MISGRILRSCMSPIPSLIFSCTTTTLRYSQKLILCCIHRKLLHESIKSAIEAGRAPTVETEASARGSDGFMHIGGTSLCVPSPFFSYCAPADSVTTYLRDRCTEPTTIG
jgi:hypothetical protein